MAIRFSKRIKLFGGLGINLGKKSASLSMRTKMGSVGTKGISVKTGVPGLTYRHYIKKTKHAKEITVENEVEEQKKSSFLVDVIFYIIVVPIYVPYLILKFFIWDWWHIKKKESVTNDNGNSI